MGEVRREVKGNGRCVLLRVILRPGSLVLLIALYRRLSPDPVDSRQESGTKHVRVDELEELGVVGPFEGAKPRAVIMSKEQWYQRKLNNIIPSDIHN